MAYCRQCIISESDFADLEEEDNVDPTKIYYIFEDEDEEEEEVPL